MTPNPTPGSKKKPINLGLLLIGMAIPATVAMHLQEKRRYEGEQKLEFWERWLLRADRWGGSAWKRLPHSRALDALFGAAGLVPAATRLVRARRGESEERARWYAAASARLEFPDCCYGRVLRPVSAGPADDVPWGLVVVSPADLYSVGMPAMFTIARIDPADGKVFDPRPTTCDLLAEDAALEWHGDWLPCSAAGVRIDGKRWRPLPPTPVSAAEEPVIL